MLDSTPSAHVEKRCNPPQEEHQVQQNRSTLPRFIHVLGQSFTVTEQPEVLDSDGTPLRGLCVANDQVILIDRNQHPETRAETLLHESLHALEEALALELGEDAILRFSRGIFALLRDNPALVRAVTS
jgi:hypothetical protein